MILDHLELTPAEFERRTGWAIKPEGACKGSYCVPLPASEGETLDARVVAERLGMPLVHDQKHGLWALGPESIGGRALTSAVAPDLSLPDLAGKEFRLSSLRGQKVALIAWAPW